MRRAADRRHRQVQVTFHCADPEQVGRFWCEALGYVPPLPPEGFATWAEYDASLPAERRGSQDVEGNEFCLD